MKSSDSWKSEYRKVSHLDGVGLLHVAGVTHDYPRHVHEESCVAMVLRGSETHISRRKSYTAFPGDLLLLNAEEAHSNQSIRAEYKSIHIDPKSFLLLSNDCIPHFAEPVVRDPRLFQSFLNLYSQLERNSSVLERQSMFLSTMESLKHHQKQSISSRSGATLEPCCIVKVRDYLRAHYSENVTLSSLASIANLSPFHLVRIFNNQVGVPPHEYQTQVRITNAQRLLRSGHSISDAAIETGFFDQSHFSRNFKRITGLTPGSYLSRSNIVQDSAK